MTKSVLTKISLQIRNLFAILVSFCQLFDLLSRKSLKMTYHLDFKHKFQNEYSDLEFYYTFHVHYESLISIEDQVLLCVGKSLSNYGLLKPQKHILNTII